MEKKVIKSLFVIAWIMIIAWRIYVCAGYLFQYVDDDQALMWYATVLFSRGVFPQPAFFGQTYGTMFESLLTVPLYLCGLPLNYAQPVITTIMGLIAFFYAGMILFRRKKYLDAFMVLVLLACMSWYWDVVTSMRCYFTGLPLTVIGVLMVNEKESGKIKTAFGSFLALLGAVWSTSAAAVLGIGGLYYLFYRPKTAKKIISMAIGAVPALAIWVYRFLFFKNHPDYVIFSIASRFGPDIWLQNIGLLGKRLAEFFFLGKPASFLIPLFIIILLIVYYRKKDRKKLILVAVAVGGSLMILASSRMNAYEEMSINYCQMRMLLYMVFLWLTIQVLFALDRPERETDDYRKICWAFFVIIFAIAVKAWGFNSAVGDSKSCLYQHYAVQSLPVREVIETGKKLDAIALKENADVCICTDAEKGMAYSLSALYYDRDHDFYIFDMDRREWVHQKMTQGNNKNIVFYTFSDKGKVEVNVVNTGELTIEEYLKSLGMNRVPLTVVT